MSEKTRLEVLPRTEEGREALAEWIEVDQEIAEQKDRSDSLTKALVPYSDNLPYDRNRVIQETKLCLAMDIQLRYEIGRRLILLRENEGGQTFGQILDEHFPGLSRSAAKNYIRFARIASSLPKFQAFASGRDNWSKALTILENVGEEELAEFENGSVLNTPVDELDKMSVRELKAKIKKLEKARDEAVSQAVKPHLDEAHQLRQRLEILEAQVAEPSVVEAEKLLAAADKKLMEAAQCIRKIPWKVVLNEPTLRRALAIKARYLEQLAVDLEQRVLESLAERDEVL